MFLKSQWQNHESGVKPRPLAPNSSIQATYLLAMESSSWALLSIENVFSQAPNYSEALFVKVQILLDGFSDINRAKNFFENS